MLINTISDDEGKHHEKNQLAFKLKTSSMLWREDLDALLIKLEEVEKKERDEETAVNKKSSKFMNANKNKNRKSLFEIIPSGNGRRVEPKISEDLIKRIQAAEKAKSRKDLKKEYDPEDPSGISPSSQEKKPKGRVKKEKVEKPEKEKDGLKQTKLLFKREPKKKKITFSGSESGDLSNSDVELADAPAPRERVSSRRAATKVQKYKDGESESESNSEVELLDNKITSEDERPRALSVSDDDDFAVRKTNKKPAVSDDDDFPVRKTNKKPVEMDSDCLFDSLIEDSNKEQVQNNHHDSVVLSSEDEAPVKTPPKKKPVVLSSEEEAPVKTPPKKKPAQKRKLMNVDKEDKPKKRPVKAILSQDSDDDSIFDSKKDKKKVNPKKKKKKGSSDSECDVAIEDSPAPRSNARARAMKKYNFSDGSDSD